VDFVSPANDDATKSIVAIVDALAGAVAEGLNERKNDKAATEKAAATDEPAAEAAEEAPASDDAKEESTEA
jgi:small subunit ribosomal protein S2